MSMGQRGIVVFCINCLDEKSL